MIWAVAVPTATVVMLTTFVVVLWRSAARDPKLMDSGVVHTERIYRDFEFFVQIFLAIGAALGYTRLEYFADSPAVSRRAMMGIAAVGMIAMATLVIFIACHQASRFRRWEVIKWHQIWQWQEPWMMLSMVVLASGLWIVAVLW